MSQKKRDLIDNTYKTVFTKFNTLLNSKKSKIKPLKNTNKKVIVLANGPSVKKEFDDKTILSEMANTDAICVNFFYKSEVFDFIKPKYYLISAPELWEEDVSELHQKNRNSLYNKLTNHVTWEMTFFIPFQAKTTSFWREQLSKNNNITIQYYNNTPIEGFESFRFRQFDKQRGTPRCHNVLGYTLMVLIWKDYKNIGIFGADHTWTKSLYVSEDNKAFLEQPHFYNTNPNLVQMHTKGKKDEKKRKFHEIIHKFYLAFKSYFEIHNYAKTKGIKIYNLTKGSFIDAFERMTPKDFFEKI